MSVKNARIVLLVSVLFLVLGVVLLLPEGPSDLTNKLYAGGVGAMGLVVAVANALLAFQAQTQQWVFHAVLAILGSMEAVMAIWVFF